MFLENYSQSPYSYCMTRQRRIGSRCCFLVWHATSLSFYLSVTKKTSSSSSLLLLSSSIQQQYILLLHCYFSSAAYENYNGKQPTYQIIIRRKYVNGQVKSGHRNRHDRPKGILYLNPFWCSIWNLYGLLHIFKKKNYRCIMDLYMDNLQEIFWLQYSCSPVLPFILLIEREKKSYYYHH